MERIMKYPYGYCKQAEKYGYNCIFCTSLCKYYEEKKWNQDQDGFVQTGRGYKQMA